MAKGMIPQLESIIGPQGKGFHAIIYFAKLVKLPLIYETNCWHLLVAQSAQQFCRHFENFGAGHQISAAGRKVVNCDCDLALCWALCLNLAPTGQQTNQDASDSCKRLIH